MDPVVALVVVFGIIVLYSFIEAPLERGIEKAIGFISGLFK